MTGLQLLDLSYNEFYGTLSGLGPLVHLRDLALDYNDIGTTLATLSVLSALSALDYSVADTGEEYTALATLTVLRRFEYSGNHIDEATLQALGSLPELRELSLGCGGFKDAHVPSTLALEKLQRLDLRSSDLGAGARMRLRERFGAALVLEDLEITGDDATQTPRVASMTSLG